MKEEKLMGHDPLSDTDAILSEQYYAPIWLLPALGATLVVSDRVGQVGGAAGVSRAVRRS